MALTATDYQNAANILGCSVPAIKAVVSVEAAGSGFTTHNGKQVPKILFEAHWFYKLSGPYPISREFPHLSSRGWNRRLYSIVTGGRKPGQNMAHARLDEACSLDAHYHTGDNRLCEAAKASSSWGIGQVMGFHWKALDYASLKAFVGAMYESEGKQLEAMVRFIKTNGLADDVKRGNHSSSTWRGFAKGYNGSGYAKNKYHIKLADAYAKAGGQ